MLRRTILTNRLLTRILVILIALGSSTLSYSQNKVNPSLSEIKNVTVFLNAVEIERALTFQTTTGLNTLVVDNLSGYIQVKSLQLSVGNDLEIKSINSEFYSEEPTKVKPVLATIQDSIKRMELQAVSLENQIKAYKTEQNLLLNNQNLSNEQTGIAIAELIKAADFFRTRSLEINNAISKLNNDLKESKTNLLKTQQRYRQILQTVDVNRARLLITLASSGNQRNSFNLKYIVDAASWSPNYDLRAKNVDSPLQLAYKGDVYNNTGIDWENVTLKLSTSDPNLEASRPYLTPWTLNYKSQFNEGRLERKSLAAEFDDAGKEIAFETPDEVEVEDINSEFTIDGTHSIKTNTDPYSVKIADYTLKAEYEYLAIPKVEQSAFLLSKATGWGNLNLISGTGQTYYGDTYIGQSKIDTRYFNDTIQFSFGRDNQILIAKSKLKDTGGKKFIGNKRTESFTYEIVVKNNKRIPIDIEIQDQVPVAQESDITVDVQNISGAFWDKTNGQLKWKIKLDPNQSVKKLISFSVKYPANKTLKIRKKRLIRTPRFRR